MKTTQPLSLKGHNSTLCNRNSKESLQYWLHLNKNYGFEQGGDWESSSYFNEPAVYTLTQAHCGEIVVYGGSNYKKGPIKKRNYQHVYNRGNNSDVVLVNWVNADWEDFFGLSLFSEAEDAIWVDEYESKMSVAFRKIEALSIVTARKVIDRFEGASLMPLKIKNLNRAHREFEMMFQKLGSVNLKMKEELEFSLNEFIKANNKRIKKGGA